MKPVLALVGRPNVGKSTLFNRITKSRAAIVADYPGLTRDRHYGQARFGTLEFIVIDTGGFEPDASSGIYKEMARQTQQAVAESDLVIFVLDAREGLSGQDHDIAKYLRRLGKTCLLVANKAEGMQNSAQWSEFFELGLGQVLPISAAHGEGIGSMLEMALAPLLPDVKNTDPNDAPDDDDDGGHPIGSGRAPQCGQINPHQYLVGRGTAGGLRFARYHPRCHTGAV